MVAELLQTQHVLWEREAELAAGVPVVVRSGTGKHLAAQLESVLRSAAAALGCHAAALYLLDEGTTVLKLRSCSGLPRQCFLAPPRPLRGAMADLEAMLGHAVVLENTRLLSHWQAPEDFPSAACVPVATSSTILGTFWVFSKEPRGFNDRETGILELVAGRLAAELEREMLVRVGVDSARLKQRWASVEQLQRSQLPAVAPSMPGWDVAGWADPDPSTSGGLFDWFSLPRGAIGVGLLNASNRGGSDALSTGSVRMALRAHGQHCQSTATVLRQTGMTLWAASKGDMAVSAFFGQIGPQTDFVRFSATGRLAIYLLRPAGFRRLACPPVLLGNCPEAKYRQVNHRLNRNEAILVLAMPPSTDGVTGFPGSIEEDPLRRSVGLLGLPAQVIVNHFRDARESGSPTGSPAMLVLRRTDP